jgi:hypothetical protein
MKTSPNIIILSEDDMIQVNACGAATAVVSGVVGWVVSHILDEAVSLVEKGLANLNAAIGSQPSPYSNPISCEYFGYY